MPNSTLSSTIQSPYLEPWGGLKLCNTTTNCFDLTGTLRYSYICNENVIGNDSKLYCSCDTFRAQGGPECSSVNWFTVVSKLGFVLLTVQSLYLAYVYAQLLRRKNPKPKRQVACMISCMNYMVLGTVFLDLTILCLWGFVAIMQLIQIESEFAFLIGRQYCLPAANTLSVAFTLSVTVSWIELIKSTKYDKSQLHMLQALFVGLAIVLPILTLYVRANAVSAAQVMMFNFALVGTVLRSVVWWLRIKVVKKTTVVNARSSTGSTVEMQSAPKIAIKNEATSESQSADTCIALTSESKLSSNHCIAEPEINIPVVSETKKNCNSTKLLAQSRRPSEDALSRTLLEVKSMFGAISKLIPLSIGNQSFFHMSGLTPVLFYFSYVQIARTAVGYVRQVHQ